MAGSEQQRLDPALPGARLDALDGLRAVAVAGVLAYHAGISGVAGGLFGVDVFFVLSGFLITRLLLAEHAASGRIRLGRFWSRRARRLLPPLILTLAGALAYARWAGGVSLSQVRGDALAALGYVANWRFVFSGQGYFVRYGPPSPLLHTWSLGVEEQFYLLWPLAVVVLARRGGPAAVARWAPAGAATSAGLMALLHNLGVGDSRLYYGTDTRAQALLVGATLAAVLAARKPSPVVSPLVLGAPGSSSLVSGSVASGAAVLPGPVGVSGSPVVSVLPGPLGVSGSPVVSVVPGPAGASGSLGGSGGGDRLCLWPRRSSLVGWAAAGGLLWFFHAVGGASAWLYDGGFLLVALLSVVVLATVVALPQSSLAQVLARRPLVALGRISYGVYLYHWPLFAWLNGARTGLTGWPLAAVRISVTLAVATASYFLVERPIRQIGQRPILGQARRSPGVRRPLVTRPLITAAGTLLASVGVVAATWPGVAAAGQERLPAAPLVGRPAVATRTLIVGDSMGLTLSKGLSQQSSAWGVTIEPGAKVGCDLDPQSTVEVMGVVSPAAQGCPQWPTSWRTLVRQDNPDVVMLVLGRWEVLNRIYDGSWTHIGDPAWDAHLTTELDQAIDVLSSRGAVVVVTTLPYIQGTTEQPNGQPWDMNQPVRTNAYNAVVRDAVARRPTTSRVIDLNALIDPNGRYTSYIDGIRVRDDDDEHFSPAGGEYLRTFILPQLEALGTPHARSRTSDASEPRFLAKGSAPGGK